MPAPWRMKSFTAFSTTIALPMKAKPHCRFPALKKPSPALTLWLHELSRKDLFAVRVGVLKFRGFFLKPSKIPFTPTGPLSDTDFEPKFEQKGVDKRIGLDMATLSANRSIE